MKNFDNVNITLCKIIDTWCLFNHVTFILSTFLSLFYPFFITQKWYADFFCSNQLLIQLTRKRLGRQTSWPANVWAVADPIHRCRHSGHNQTVCCFSSYQPFILTSLSEWRSNVQRDSLASYIGHPDSLTYFSAALNEPRAVVKTSFIDVCIVVIFHINVF